jgi:hypothetical protein
MRSIQGSYFACQWLELRKKPWRIMMRIVKWYKYLSDLFEAFSDFWVFWEACWLMVFFRSETFPCIHIPIQARCLPNFQITGTKMKSLDRSHYWQESRQKLTFWKRCFLINFENMPNKNRRCNHNQHAQLLYVRVNSSWQMLTEPALIDIPDLPVASERFVQRCENVR